MQLPLTMDHRKSQSYRRGDYATDTLFTFLTYKQLGLLFAKKPGTETRCQDGIGLALLQQGRITREKYETYCARLCGEYFHKDQHPEQSPEEIYRYACLLRRECFGEAPLMEARQFLKDSAPSFDPGAGIDQRKTRDRLLKNSKAPLCVLTQPELWPQMEADLAAAGATVTVLAGDGSGDLPTRGEFARWLSPSHKAQITETVPEDTDLLLFYGEEGLLHCRSLSVDAVVYARPMGYHAQALCNQLGAGKDNVIYIPPGLELTPWVPLVDISRCTYYHLARLQALYGDDIYSLSVPELYSRYPDVFANIYDTTGSALPFPVKATGLADFDAAKEAAIGEYLNSFSNLTYISARYDEALRPIALDGDVPGILVHSIRVRQAKDAQVITCPKGVTPRQLLAEQQLPGTALISNFLFFMTPKLGMLYNELRKDRPREQADAAAGHLDYMRISDSGHLETFPLFAKTCIGKTRDGRFLFFPFRLGGGAITLGELTLRWEADAVDPEVPGDICIYTPFCSQTQEDADREVYRMAVGQGRVNLVILQDKVTCLRQGDVILPSTGVVLSLTEATAKPLLENLPQWEDGYYDPAGLSLQLRLDPPQGFPVETWSQIQWAYGGGMALLLDGKGLDEAEPLEWFRQGGWLTPLSRQTQESALHKMAKHPRTAIGTTKNGDLVILVYSGRTKRSAGADYLEMLAIARQLYPDIENLMNVDGGGSAVLGMAQDGSFLELSLPATSSGSCAGMVRPIHTLFYIPAEKEN